ncbi:MAG: excinuclease ABC subunit C [Rickettsiales bacterium]|nr:excinuclease ABC subunit C [Rickettsiales bacterium]|tara:strand:+ start:1380 stop:3287 length:1908 start_codon:yes stop_codon:yes gene_type:complete
MFRNTKNYIKKQLDKKPINHLEFNNLKGQEIIKFTAKTLPQKPGVYQMENEKGEILYIGKAKNLSKRVINYASNKNLTRRLQLMVNLTKNLNFFVTNTEIEALLLECNLIKRHKPRFNIILRDDKSFPYILLNKEYEYTRIQKYRGAKKIKGDYFGPFVSPSVANSTIVSLQKTFLLRSCSESTFKNRSRPCILYDIKRCSAPCVKYISIKNYKESIEDAKKFLNGNTKKIEKKLNLQMEYASKKQMYEEAARIRDRIKSINQIQKYQSVYIKDMRNIDIFSIKLVNGKSCIHGKFYRNGSNYGNKSFFPLHQENSEDNEILESFLYQFYSDKEAPPKILININDSYFKEVEKTLNKKNKLKTKILKPKSGEKLQHILLAEKNAFESIRLKNTNFEAHQEALKSLSSLLKMNTLPDRIEIYDNSHTFGKNAVGVMIVADKEGLSPKHYRKFNIKYNLNEDKVAKNDDYYMMKEVLYRRLSKLNADPAIPQPKVIIIDGGRGQYNVVKSIFNKLNLKKIKLISISKGKERKLGNEIIHTENQNIKLKHNSSLLFFIQKLRDEAHRFAITAHRSKRSKNNIKSIFEDIPGVGPKRKKMLMLHFGNVNKIKIASIQELSKVKKLPPEVINQIYKFFNS